MEMEKDDVSTYQSDWDEWRVGQVTLRTKVGWVRHLTSMREKKDEGRLGASLHFNEREERRLKVKE